MEDKDSKISQELNKNKIASAPYEDVEDKCEAAPQNGEGQQKADNSMSDSEDGIDNAFEDELRKYLKKEHTESPQNYLTGIKKLSSIIKVCEGKNDYKDFSSDDVDAFLKIFKKGEKVNTNTIKNIFAALSAYSGFLKEHRVTSSKKTPTEPLQQIFYGAPGTGKSHKITELTYTVSEENVIRTTFHPDSDYSTFVGAYKPTTQEVTVMDIKDGQAVPVKQGESDYKESKIVYEFVEQSFLKAYIKAWKNYVSAVDGKKPEDVYLVIEEINRGNCAQIFGDLFQLLDRNDDGFSDYEIHADKDMQRHLQKAFKDLIISKAKYANEDVSKRVLNGDILQLPNNLYIWATMNTSDQSLFPIDSAFKRRWDWKYVPITNAGNNWKIKADSQTYDWWDFLEKINEKIEEVTKSEDKQLGYFFCKPRPDNPEEISAETFVSKVIFYLWNDVFKDFNYNTNSPFKKKDKGSFSFRNFYTEVGEGVNEATVAEFLKNLGLKSEEEKNQQPDDNGSASPSPDNKNSDEVSPENKTTDPTDNNNDSSGMPTDEE